MAAQTEFLTKEKAIQSVSRRYQLGTFLLKLWKDAPAVIRADKLRRLELAHEEARRAIRHRYGAAQ